MDMRVYQKNIMMFSAIGIFLLFQKGAYCQVDSVHDAIANKTQLPMLEVLIDSAMKNSPLLKMSTHDILIKKQEIKQLKTSWMKNIGFEADARYGVFDNIGLNQYENETDQLIFVNNESKRYNAGVYIKIPLSDIIHRSSEIKIMTYEVEKLKAEQNKRAQEIKIMITDLYYDILLTERSLKINGEHKILNQLQSEAAEMDYTNHRISLQELTRIKEAEAKAVIAFEKDHLFYTKSIRQMEFIIGSKIKKSGP